MTDPRDKVVYLHLDSNGEVFYVGAGKSTRPNIFYGRSKTWDERAEGGVTVEILAENLTLEEAEALEVRTIDLLRREGVPIVNVMKGGYIPQRTQDQRDSVSGEKNHFYGKRHTEEMKKSHSKLNSGKGNPQYGKTGKDAARWGMGHSDDAKKRIGEGVTRSKTGIPAKILTCPHCGKSGGNSNMTRYHFDNCKTVKPVEMVTCPHCDKTSVASTSMNRWHFDNCKQKPTD